MKTSKALIILCAIVSTSIGTANAQTKPQQAPTQSQVQAQAQQPKAQPAQPAPPVAKKAPEAAVTAPPRDYFESVNRVIFGVNALVADYVVEPTARFLRRYTPDMVKKAGSNIYENITEPEFVVTNLLAGRPKESLVSLGRFAINSTVGIAGLFDPAGYFGLVRNQTELSEAMCRAGAPLGPYIVLPVVGPTNLFSGGLVGGLLLADVYGVGLLAELLEAGAQAALGAGASLISLRHVGEVPDDSKPDPYALQQKEYWDGVKNGCVTPPAPAGKPATAALDGRAVHG
jgi:phospholipid-binding lipoprotein MlaA